MGSGDWWNTSQSRPFNMIDDNIIPHLQYGIYHSIKRSIP